MTQLTRCYLPPRFLIEDSGVKKLERFDELMSGKYVGFDWRTTNRAYIPFVETEDFCLYFVRLERCCDGKLEEIIHETTFVLKVEWVR